jgi:hypothetical protein
VTGQRCIWDQEISYELQVELMLTLQRLSEHFASASLSIQQSRPFDGVCITVMGCLAAVADAVMRQIAPDEAAEVSSHLSGRTAQGRQLGHPGFGISAGTFASQTETIEVHSPELVIARTAVLDYFQSPAQLRLKKIFSWEESYVLEPGRNLIMYLRRVSREIGHTDAAGYSQLIDGLPEASLLMKNYPQLRSYRDVVFWWKYFLNADRKVFPNYCDPVNPQDVPRTQRLAAQLCFQWNAQEGGFQVTSLGGRELRCRPNPNQTNPATGVKMDPDHLPTHRFPSTATPSFYVSAPAIKTEDDVIYRPNLPAFENQYGQVQ